MLHLIAIHADLVASNNGLQTIVFAEFLGDIRAKLHADTTLAGPTALLLLGISPQHLHHQTRLAGLSLVVSVQLANVFQRNLVIREETAVQDQVLVANQGSQGKSRETLGEELEDSGKGRKTLALL